MISPDSHRVTSVVNGHLLSTIKFEKNTFSDVTLAYGGGIQSKTHKMDEHIKICLIMSTI